MPDGSQTTASEQTTQSADASTQTQSTESQTQTTQTTDESTQTQSTETKSEPAKKAPEAYKFEAPEGQSYDEKVIGVYSEVARKLDLTQESAQEILAAVAPVMAERQAEAIQAVRAEWEAAAKSDKEYGGQDFEANLAVAKKGRDAIATPEFVEFLNASGLGNHPEIIRVFHRVGKLVGEDGKIVTGAATKETPKSTAQRMYPNMNP